MSVGNAHRALSQVKKSAAQARREKLGNPSTRLIVGTATCGVSAGAKLVVDALEQEIGSRHIKDTVVTETGCSGRCDLEPLVQVMKDGEPPVMYYHVTPEKARRIVQQHIQNGEPVQEWALT